MANVNIYIEYISSHQLFQAQFCVSGQIQPAKRPDVIESSESQFVFFNNSLLLCALVQ
jgi:hypothetical protein